MGSDDRDIGRLAVFDNIGPDLVIFSRSGIGDFQQSILFRNKSFGLFEPLGKLIAFMFELVNVLFSLDMQPIEVKHIGKLQAGNSYKYER